MQTEEEDKEARPSSELPWTHIELRVLCQALRLLEGERLLLGNYM